MIYIVVRARRLWMNSCYEYVTTTVCIYQLRALLIYNNRAAGLYSAVRNVRSPLRNVHSPLRNTHSALRNKKQTLTPYKLRTEYEIKSEQQVAINPNRAITLWLSASVLDRIKHSTEIQRNSIETIRCRVLLYVRPHRRREYLSISLIMGCVWAVLHKVRPYSRWGLCERIIQMRPMRENHADGLYLSILQVCCFVSLS